MMKYGLSTVAYWEPRFITPFLKHIPEWIDEIVVLNSSKPWMGEHIPNDPTAELAEPYSTVIQTYWPTEQDQRNTGQMVHEDKDWVIVLDPDEFLDNEGWESLKQFLETTDADAVVVEGQNTYWKNGFVADPARDYQMLIAARPHVQFVDKRVVGTSYAVAPVWLHHFSWAKTDEEVWRKISHYAHANDFDIEDWYDNKWLKWKEGDTDVHPTTPDTLHNLIRVVLPPELDGLNLWPQ